MKRIVLIFLLISFVFQNVSAQDCGTCWWRNEFVIGTTYDPPIKYVKADTVWKYNIDLAKQAGFNFFAGEQMNHRNGPVWGLTENVQDYDSIKSYSPECHASIMQWFIWNKNEIENYTGDAYANIKSLWKRRLGSFDLSDMEDLDGVFVMDEPTDSASSGYISCIDFLKKVLCSSRLFYICLAPSYMGLKNNRTYKDYLTDYLYPGTPLQVACFDNYFHTSYFESNPLGNNSYYYNLALMRHMADTAGVPLWSYINTCEPRFITKRDTVWQAASMRLAAFAPLAYGAKGLMYFSYDSRHPNQVRAFKKASGGMSDNTYYLRLPTDTTENVFLGHLRDGAKTDIAVKRDTNLGDWYIKLSDSIMTDSIDCILGWYGHRVVMLPFLCYRPDLKRDVIAGLHIDGRLFLTDTIAGWTHHITLPEVQQDWWQQLTDRKVSSFRLDGSSLDFCIARNGSVQDTLYIYRDLQMSPADNTHSSSQKIPLSSGEHVFQLVRDQGDLYAVTKAGSLFSLCRVYENNNGIAIDKKSLILPSSHADHFWVEKKNGDSICVFMQLKPFHYYNNSRIFSGKTSLSGTSCILNIPENISDFSRIVYSLRRYGTNTYDRFGIWDKRVYDEALIDGTGQPTVRYHMAKQNNLYIRDVLSPIILGAEWKGAWHTPPSTLPHDNIDMYVSDTQGGYVKMLDDNSDYFLKDMEDNMIAGKFETDSCYYYFFVDKGGEAYTDCSIRLSDDGISSGTRRVEALQSLSGEPRQLTSHQNNDGTVTFTWDRMLGGELVPIKIMK